jgi:hypothetical protein
MGRVFRTHGEKRKTYTILVKRPEETIRKTLTYGKNNIKIDLRENGMVWTGLIWLRAGPVAGSCEQGNEPSGFIKCWDIL